MAQQLLISRIPIPSLPDDRCVIQSILQFDTHNGNEEVFLLYSKGRENGPSIVRDGKGSPWMMHPNPERLGIKTTDADIQRYGTYFLNKVLKEDEVNKLESRINKLKRKINKSDEDKELRLQLKELLKSNQEQHDYEEIFRKYYPEYKIVAVQGIGDLTMNHWNVAYINDRITGKPEILHLLDEPIHDRVYSCFIKWKNDHQPKYEIKDVRFNRYEFNVRRNSPWVVQYDNRPIADQIEFAVFGQQMIRPCYSNSRNSYVVHPREIVHQFSDIRHIFQIPNLNPKKPFNDGSFKDRGIPRIYFGKNQMDDIWLGEAELLDSKNLRKAAIADSVELNMLYSGLGASREQVKAALNTANYTQINNMAKPLYWDRIPKDAAPPDWEPKAEWRFVQEDESLVEIRLKENRYPCTIIGIDNSGKVYMLAWAGIYSASPGWTFRQAAHSLYIRGVKSAILCDEGNDVFQYFLDGGTLTPAIKSKRGQVRAIIVVAQRNQK